MEWQLIFRLARRLLALPGSPQAVLDDYLPAVDAFCIAVHASDLIGNFVDFSRESFEDRWIEFVDALHKVRFPEGSGPLELAFAQAQRAPILPEPEIGKDYVLLASTAYHLQLMMEADPILLPVERVGRLFRKNKMHGSRLVQLLVHYGIVEVVAAEFSYASHRAKAYRFVFDSGLYRGPEVRS